MPVFEMSPMVDSITWTRIELVSVLLIFIMWDCVFDQFGVSNAIDVVLDGLDNQQIVTFAIGGALWAVLYILLIFVKMMLILNNRETDRFTNVLISCLHVIYYILRYPIYAMLVLSKRWVYLATWLEVIILVIGLLVIPALYDSCRGPLRSFFLTIGEKIPSGEASAR
jgi:hypothetical protein